MNVIEKKPTADICTDILEMGYAAAFLVTIDDDGLRIDSSTNQQRVDTEWFHRFACDMVNAVEKVANPGKETKPVYQDASVDPRYNAPVPKGALRAPSRPVAEVIVVPKEESPEQGEPTATLIDRVTDILIASSCAVTPLPEKVEDLKRISIATEQMEIDLGVALVTTIIASHAMRKKQREPAPQLLESANKHLRELVEWMLDGQPQGIAEVGADGLVDEAIALFRGAIEQTGIHLIEQWRERELERSKAGG